MEALGCDLRIAMERFRDWKRLGRWAAMDEASGRGGCWLGRCRRCAREAETVAAESEAAQIRREQEETAGALLLVC